MTGPLYILDDEHQVIAEPDLWIWGWWMEHKHLWRVALTTIGEAEISTVFLGIDQNYRRIGPPLVFETMIYGGDLGGQQARYATWAEAEAGHARWVAAVTAGALPDADGRQP